MGTTESLKGNKKSRIFILSILVILFFALEATFSDNITKIEGAKLGLYNAFVVFAIINLKPRYGYTLAIVKLVASLFIASTVFLYPLLGGLTSVIAMVIAKKIFNEKISYLGMGVVGAIIYNLTVYIIAAISLSSLAVFYNIPKVFFMSVIYGAITGSLSYLLHKSNILRLGYGEENEKK